ncbi:Pyruvate kinase [Klebsiella pneumoniae IS39]|nr:Pyruvate kinase [Klebsiella pneumoniae IS39]
MSRRLRRTKIVTTLGPATDRDNNLEKVIAAGANVVRMNFSHGTPEDHQLRADKVREIAAKLGRHVAILGDLQGPKNSRIDLQRRQNFSSTSAINSCSTQTLAKAKATKRKSGSTIKACRRTSCRAISYCSTMVACS